MARAHDQVGLPIPQAPFVRHDRRPLLNAGAMGNLRVAGVAAVTFALLLLAAQMAIEQAATLLIGIYVAVDPLMANRRLLLQLQAPGNLLGAPLLPQQQFDQVPGRTAAAATMEPRADCRAPEVGATAYG